MNLYYHKEISKDFHNVIVEVADYLICHHGATPCAMSKSEIIIEGKPLKIADCDLLIHEPEIDRYKAVNFSDNQNQLVSFFIRRNNPKDIILCSQYANTKLYEILDTCKFKVKPSIYTKSDPKINLDDIHKKRKEITYYEDKFVFWGNYEAAKRNAINHLKKESFFSGGGYISNYFEELIKYKVGLSIPGLGELCYRDIEYMAIGIPMMKFEYVTQLNPPLIPNYHYISVPRIDTKEDFNYNGGIIAKEREAEKRHADAYVKRYLEVKDNDSFLIDVSKNARDYYDTYLHPSKRVYHLIKLLEIEK